MATIKLNDRLYNKIKKRVNESEFKSVDGYISYVLEQVVSKLDNEEKPKRSMEIKEEQQMKERLRSLGYLD